MNRNADDGVAEVEPTTASLGGETQRPVMSNPAVELPEGVDDTDTGTDEADSLQVKKISAVDFQNRLAQQKEMKDKLAARSPQMGNPNASLADPIGAQVQPRYVVIQNRSITILHMPDLRSSNPDDQGLMMQPGEVVVLTDFYTPMEINRSRGLRYAATKMPGIDGRGFAMVPLNNEEEGSTFVLPEKKKYAPGTSFDDDSDNPFDDRFDELEKREAKREEKLVKKTLAGRKQKKHGSSPSHV